MLVPSVAFRHHPSTMELTALAQASDDWILYIQGDTFILLLIKKITSQYSRMVF
jgi:hypothetical protein